VEVAKALGGSFKLVTLAPKNCKGDDSTAHGNTKEWGHKQVSLAKLFNILVANNSRPSSYKHGKYNVIYSLLYLISDCSISPENTI